MNQDNGVRTAKTRITILLAEDDEDDVYFFKEAVAELSDNFEVTTAVDGIECMQLLQNGLAPDLVFLDINMPMKTGFQCLQEIRRDEKLKKLTVIVLSTASDTQIIKHAYALGADLYIAKSSEYNKFKSSLLYALRETSSLS